MQCSFSRAHWRPARNRGCYTHPLIHSSLSLSPLQPDITVRGIWRSSVTFCKHSETLEAPSAAPQCSVGPSKHLGVFGSHKHNSASTTRSIRALLNLGVVLQGLHDFLQLHRCCLVANPHKVRELHSLIKFDSTLLMTNLWRISMINLSQNTYPLCSEQSSS